MKFDLKNNYPFLILFYTILFFSMYGVLYYFNVVDEFPNQQSIVKCDAGFYESIKTNGYEYKVGEGCNAGFFPLFSYFWKVTTLSPIGISIVNGLLYMTGLYFLCRLLKPNYIVLGLFMSLPCMYFMFTPYTEPLFFLFSTGILYGIIKNNNKILFISLLLASLTRASFLFFIPALIAISMLSLPKSELLKKQTWLPMIQWQFTPIFISFMIIGMIQYIQIDNFFAYYEIQSSIWGRKFGLPVFPLGRHAEDAIVKLTWFNFWIGMFVCYLALKYFWEWLFKGTLIHPTNKHTIFSIVYLVMTFFAVIFFNPEWNWIDNGGYNATILAGINRYLQANPFMLVLLIYLFDHFKSKLYYIILMLLSTYIIWLMVAPDYYTHIHSLRNVTIVSLFLLSYWIYHYYRWKLLAYTIILFSIYLQCIMFNFYMKNILVD